jgi:hypothetical protein
MFLPLGVHVSVAQLTPLLGVASRYVELEAKFLLCKIMNNKKNT